MSRSVIVTKTEEKVEWNWGILDLPLACLPLRDFIQVTLYLWSSISHLCKDLTLFFFFKIWPLIVGYGDEWQTINGNPVIKYKNQWECIFWTYVQRKLQNFSMTGGKKMYLIRLSI